MNEVVLIVLCAISFFNIIVFGCTILIPRIQVNRKVFFLFVISLAIVSMGINPGEGWDLYRHYEQILRIKQSGLSFYDFVFNNTMRIGGADFADLFAFNIVRYLVAWIGEPRLLSFILTLVTYLVWYWISIDWAKTHQLTGKKLLYATLMNMVLMPYIFVNSGLRNTTATAIGALAIYLHLYKKERILVSLILFFIAFMFHSATIFLAIVYGISLIKKDKLAILSVLVVCFVLPLFATYAKESDVSYVRKAGYSFWIYFRRDWSRINAYLLADYCILVSVFGVLCRVMLTKKRGLLTEGEHRLGRYLMVLCFLLICNTGTYELIVRPAYVLGMFSTPLVYFVCDGQLLGKRISVRNEKILFIAVFVAFALVTRVSLPEYLFASWF